MSFRSTTNKNRIVIRNKARLVTKGYNQQEGIGFDETYTPVSRLKSIRMLLAFACFKSLLFTKWMSKALS